MPPFKKFSRAWLLNQFKINIVAIISLITAIFSFSYNNWQNYQDEKHMNMRIAAFEVLKNLGELQTVVNYAHFADDKLKWHPIDGWKYANMIRDLAHLLTPQVAKEGEKLSARWGEDWEKIEQSDEAEARVSAQIAKTRQAVLTTIDQLE